MIHVQIASQVTAQGVSGVRWVLVEALDAPLSPEADAVNPAAGPPGAADLPAPSGSPAAGTLQLGALKLVVVGLGLGAALWTAHVQIGPPSGAHAAPPAAPQVTPATPATQGRPGLSMPPTQAQPLPPATVTDPAAAPSPAASGNPPRLTAAL
jgi:hypothetical protein